jgi:hypothetical protein
MRNRKIIVELCDAANEPRGPGFLGSQRHQRDVEGKFIQLLIIFNMKTIYCVEGVDRLLGE